MKKNILAVNLRKICTQAQNWGFEAAVLSFFFVLSVFFVVSVLFVLSIFFSVCPLCHVRPLCPQLSILFVLSCSSSLSSLSILLVMPLFLSLKGFNSPRRNKTQWPREVCELVLGFNPYIQMTYFRSNQGALQVVKRATFS